MMYCYVFIILFSGIIHSDLKPSNFILVGGILKLIDFGIAKSIQNDKTSVLTDTQVGTLNYMSPETITDTCGDLGGGSERGRPVYKVCDLHVYTKINLQLK